MQNRIRVNSFRLPSLDGWRAVSIALVLGAHSRHTAGFPSGLTQAFDWLFDGGLGVRFFFIISGFLITWLMISEHDQKGRVSLKHFYARRALRILPVYCAFIVALIMLGLVTPYRQTAGTWIGNLTFTTNFVEGGNWVSGHLWSLSVEEQFYLLWPVVCVSLGLITNLRRALLVLSVPILLAPASRVITNAVAGGASHQIGCLASLSALWAPLGFLFGPFSFFNYFDSLAWGVGGALLLARHSVKAQTQLLRGRFYPMFWLGVLLIVVPYVLGHLHAVKWLTGSVGNTLQACGFDILLLQSVMSPNRRIYRALNWWWVTRIGILSYSIYIWQQIFCADPALFGLKPVWWMSFPGWLFSVFAVASVSYYGFERPLLNLRTHFRDVKQ